MAPLGSLFENRSILKILHGSDYDLLSLKRDFHFKIGPIFDTALAARAVGIPSFSLQGIVERFFQVPFPKTHQKSDWSRRPLSESQLEYASSDTAFLIQLYQILLAEVQQKGRLDQIEEELLLLEQIEWSAATQNGPDPLRMKGARALSLPAQGVLVALAEVRGRLAEARDVPTFKIVSNDDLLAIAKALPETEEALLQIFTRPRSAIVRHLGAWFQAVVTGRLTPPIPPPKKSPARPPPTHAQERLLAKIVTWRNGQAASEGVEPAMVVTGPVLRALVMDRVRSKEGLSPLLRRWQITRYGDPLLQILSETTPERTPSSAPSPTAALPAPSVVPSIALVE